ncbi:MAG: carbohydrate ABC transporter permease, partial [bacterium]|nr:carbohydrate ABC transporter permease [bacterium]
MHSKRKEEILIRIIVYVLLIISSIIILIPVFWMLSTALKEDSEVYLFPPEWIPKRLYISNFIRALTFLPFGRYFLNTGLITFLSVIGQLISSSLVAFGFARLRARGKDLLFMLVLSTMMIPSQITMIPIFVLFKLLNWVDTFKPLIIPNFFGGAFFIFLLRQFYMTIPIELDDAAKIDGCSYFGIYTKIVLPLTKPALATVAIFTFMWTWNDFMGPLIYLNSREKLTLSLALSRFTGMYGICLLYTSDA